MSSALVRYNVRLPGRGSAARVGRVLASVAGPPVSGQPHPATNMLVILFLSMGTPRASLVARPRTRPAAGHMHMRMNRSRTRPLSVRRLARFPRRCAGREGARPMLQARKGKRQENDLVGRTPGPEVVDAVGDADDGRVGRLLVGAHRVLPAVRLPTARPGALTLVAVPCATGWLRSNTVLILERSARQWLLIGPRGCRRAFEWCQRGSGVNRDGCRLLATHHTDARQ